MRFPSHWTAGKRTGSNWEVVESHDDTLKLNELQKKRKLNELLHELPSNSDVISQEPLPQTASQTSSCHSNSTQLDEIPSLQLSRLQCTVQDVNGGCSMQIGESLCETINNVSNIVPL